MRAQTLRTQLWGDYYFDMKSRSIKSGAYEHGKKPTFVQMILDNVWTVYDVVLLSKDAERTAKVLASLNVQLPAREQKNKDARVMLKVSAYNRI